jgi:hypothetical protein
MKSVKSKSPSAFKSAFTFGLGASLGAAFITMLLIGLALLFFIPGLLMLSAERKKKKEDQDESKLIIAYVLMGIGVILGLGMGANFLFSNLMEDF